MWTHLNNTTNKNLNLYYSTKKEIRWSFKKNILINKNNHRTNTKYYIIILVVSANKREKKKNFNNLGL